MPLDKSAATNTSVPTAILPNTPAPYTFTQIIDADHFTIQRLASQIRKILSLVSPSSSSPSLPPSATQTVTESGTPINPRTYSPSSGNFTSPPSAFYATDPYQPSIFIPIPVPTDSPTPKTTKSGDASPKPNISQILASLKPPLLEATWRLIRHDFSEDTVMRPAFIHVLGEQQGKPMAERDRTDHAEARAALLSILDKLATLNTPRGSEHERRKGFLEISQMTTTVLDDLGRHMAVESGDFLPYFESIVDPELSRRLAREYAATLIMTPFVVDLGGKRVFQSELEYIRGETVEMRRLWEGFIRGADESVEGRSRFGEMIEREIEILNVGKWKGKLEISGTTTKEKGKL